MASFVMSAYPFVGLFVSTLEASASNAQAPRQVPLDQRTAGGWETRETRSPRLAAECHIASAAALALI
jgi:hypothetical protein